MEIGPCLVDSAVADGCFPSVPTPQQPRSLRPWLLELEVDGTIRYSNIYPQRAAGDGLESMMGSNVFELPELRELTAFRRDFVSFVRGVRNRQSLRLRSADGGETVAVLTRSFDTGQGGLPNEIVLMELKGI